MTTTPPGLTPDEVVESRRIHGANALTPPRRDPWYVLYLEKFKDPIIRILIIAALVALVVGVHDGNFIEGIGIILAIFLSTGLSFLNEHRAAREFDILNKVADDDPVPVIRGGRHRTAPKKDLVVGDIVLVEQGMEIPADGAVLEAVNLSLNESSLTGESGPVRKDASAGDAGAAFPRNFAPRGCTVADGHGLMRITAVGDRTEIGKTARAAAETPDAMTPLARQLEKLAGMISVAAFAAAAVIFIAQTVRGAANGEIFALAEQGGKLVKAPLQPGQWLCFALLALAALIVAAPIWVPTLRGGLKFLGRPNLLPARLDRLAAQSFRRLAIRAAAVFAAGALIGLVTGLLSFRAAWLPVSALTAFISYFMLAVTVIVVAVPEGLPMCVALALAYSMRKMTASNNLVRRMHACETIGAATVICSDKTGTLTMNEMRVHRAVFPFVADGILPAGGAAADCLAESVSANSTANLQETDGKTEPLGNPTEAATLLWLKACGREYRTERAGFALRQQITFSTERKYMASAGVSRVDGKPRLYVKGGPEIVISRCAAARRADGTTEELTGAERARILEEAGSYQNRGMRSIGFASKEVAEETLAAPIDPGFGGCVWEGFFAIADPIRPDVPKAMERARAAGIQVKVVTGDNQSTAREIARQAGLWREDDTDDRIVAGERFAAMDDGEAAATARRIKIMSRARPLDKLRLVRLLQAGGEVVAVTGDGTNDAPALNHADVGLAMGRTGTAVAKEAADIILLDDSFASIVNAVAWGRSLYANIRKFVVFQLTINVAAVGIALLGPFLGVTLPLTVVQMLWVNLIMDTFAALALASEPPDWDLMENAPRAPDASIVTGPMRKCILGVGAAFIALFLAVMALQRWIALDPARPEGRYNLTVFFSVFVFMQFWNLWNARVFGTTRSAFRNLRGSKGFLLMAGVVAAGQYFLVQFGGEMFRVVPLSGFAWAMIIVLTSPVLWIGEFWRLHLRSRDDPDYYRYS